MGGQADRRASGRGQTVDGQADGGRPWMDKRTGAGRRADGRMDRRGCGRADKLADGRTGRRADRGGRWRTDFRRVKLLN